MAETQSIETISHVPDMLQAILEDTEPETLDDFSENEQTSPLRNKNRASPWKESRPKGGRPSNAERRAKAEKEAAEADELRKAADALAKADADLKEYQESDDAAPQDLQIPNFDPRTQSPWEYLTLFPREMWESQLFMYLYRCAPIIDRTAVGKFKYISKYSQAIDQNTVMLDEGSGNYRIDLVCYNPPTGKTNRIRQFYFEILNPKFPPKVPLGEWVNDPANKNWEWAKPLLAAEESVNKIAAASGVSSPMHLNPAEMLRTVSDTFRSLQPPPADNTLLNTLIAKLVDKPAGQDPMLMLVMEELRESRKEAAELRNRIFTAPPTATKSLVEQLTELKQINELVGRPRAEKGQNWGDRIADILSEIVKQAPAALAAMRPQQQRPPMQGQASVPTLANPAVTAPQPEIQRPPMDQDEEEKIYAFIEKHAAVIQGAAPRMFDDFDHETGYDFRDWIIKRHGISLWHEFRQSMTAEQLTKMMQLNSYLAAKMHPEEKVLGFFEEFFTAVGEEPVDEVGEEANEPAQYQNAI